MRELLPELLKSGGITLPVVSFSTHELADEHIKSHEDIGNVKLLITNASPAGVNTGLDFAKKVIGMNVTRGNKQIPVMVISENRQQLIPATKFGAHGVWHNEGDNFNSLIAIVKRLLEIKKESG